MEPDRTERDEERASDPLITVMTIIDESVRLPGWREGKLFRFARHSRAHRQKYFVKKPSSRTLVLGQANLSVIENFHLHTKNQMGFGEVVECLQRRAGHVSGFEI